MADQVATKTTALGPEEVLVRAVQFFTNDTWPSPKRTELQPLSAVQKCRCFSFCCWPFCYSVS